MPVAKESSGFKTNEELVAHIKKDDFHSDKVTNAFSRVDRKLFVPKEYHRDSDGEFVVYHDHALPIGLEQTISQPSLVALMLNMLRLEAGQKVLEVGTGRGYSTALTAHAMGSGLLHSFEVHRQLCAAARRNIARTRLPEGVKIVLHARDVLGKPLKARYDRIVVHAKTPEKTINVLAENLNDGGRMVVPAEIDGVQLLLLLKKIGGELHRTPIIPVAFVPLTGKHGN